MSLGTLQTSNVITVAFDETSPETCFVSSIVVSVSLNNLTAPQGPLTFGVAHSDYTATEIQEVLNSVGSWDRGDKISQERGKRLVRKMGILTAPVASGTTDVRMWDGGPRKFKLNWLLAPGDGLQMWCWNNSEGTLATTDPELSMIGHANLWMR